MIRRARRGGREVGKMRKGRRERIEKGSREGIGKRERDKKFEEKEGLRDPPPPPPHFFKNFLDLALRCSHCFFKSSEYDKLELKHQKVFVTSL